MTTSHRSSTRTTARRATLRALAVAPVALGALAMASAPASSAPAVPAGSSDAVVGLLAPGEETSAGAEVEARDGRLRPGCRSYPVRYAVQDAGDDWLLELVVRDRSGEQVASAALHGVESPRRGRTTVTLCRTTAQAGRFAVDGVLTERAGYEQVEHPVEGDRFWLTRR